jgi:hypothetical protein
MYLVFRKKDMPGRSFISGGISCELRKDSDWRPEIEITNA